MRKSRVGWKSNWWKRDGSDTKEYVMVQVGKKAAGRTLDGKIWNEFPGSIPQEG